MRTVRRQGEIGKSLRTNAGILKNKQRDQRHRQPRHGSYLGMPLKQKMGPEGFACAGLFPSKPSTKRIIALFQIGYIFS